MNDVLKGVLRALEAVGASAVPGGLIVDSAVRAAIGHRGDPVAQVEDAFAGAEGAIKAIEAIKGVDIADESSFKAGCFMVDQGLKVIRASLKAATPA